MDYLTLIPDIISRMRRAGANADAIEDAFLSSSTSSELLLSVTYQLMNIVRESAELNRLIGTDVRALRTYCRSLGLIIH